MARKKFQRFRGNPTTQMLKLLADGQVPASIEDIAKKRIGQFDFPNDSDGRHVSVTTGNVILYQPGGKIKIGYGNPQLWQLVAPDAQFTNMGAVILPDGCFEEQKGLVELTITEAMRLSGGFHSPEEAIENRLWESFIEDEEVRTEYTKKAFGQANKLGQFPRYSSFSTVSQSNLLGIVFDHSLYYPTEPCMRLLRLDTMANTGTRIGLSGRRLSSHPSFYGVVACKGPRPIPYGRKSDLLIGKMPRF